MHPCSFHKYISNEEIEKGWEIRDPAHRVPDVYYRNLMQRRAARSGRERECVINPNNGVARSPT